MQMILNKAIKQLILILLVCMLIMGDVAVIAENIVQLTNEQEINENEEILAISQELITNQVYKIGKEDKRIVQLALEINASNLKNSSLRENEVILTTPILFTEPEEIYISEQKRANFVNATWKYENGNVVIYLENDEIEKNKAEKIDKLILTYVYDEGVDVSLISTKMSSVGKLYNGQSIVVEETSYEVENTKDLGSIVQINNSVEDVYRTELKNTNQEFTENVEVNLSYKNNDLLNQITLSDNSINVYSGENIVDLNTRYKTTIINKEELLKAIGEDGTLVIKSDEEEITKIDKSTEVDKNGDIVVNYEETISKIKIQINVGEAVKTKNQVENFIFNIIHKREIEQNKGTNVLDKQLKTTDVILAKDAEIARFLVASTRAIKAKKTKTEIGLNKQELTATQENELIATITMHTGDKKYDLNKNPKYEIVLPKEIETAELGKISILNNRDFAVEREEVLENTNGQKVVVIELKGEQTEYVEEAGNVQIIVPFKVTTSKLIPTINTIVELYYTNQKAESYETSENYGRKEIEINIVSDKDLILATEATIGEEKVLSYKTDIETLNIEKNEERQIVEIKGTIINNTDAEERNLILKGENELLSEISLNKGKVYYSNTQEGPWADTFAEGNKYYKIEIETIEKGEIIEFTYNMQIPGTLEENEQYDVKYSLYKAEELQKESKLLVAVEVEEPEEPEEPQEPQEPSIEIEGVEIKYNSKIENVGGYPIENVEIGSRLINNITLKNNSEQEQNVNLKVQLPACIDMSNISAVIYKETNKTDESGDIIYEYSQKVEPIITENIATYNINLEANTKILVDLNFYVEKYVSSEVIIKINVLVGDEQKEFINTMKALTPANIQATMQAYFKNKEIKTGENIQIKRGEELQYIAIIKNTGGTAEYIEGAIDIPPEFIISKIEVYKDDVLISELEESEVNRFITNKMEIKENEKLKIVSTLKLKNGIEEDTTVEQYMTINENIETNRISIKLLKETLQGELPSDEEENKNQKHNISGIAWLDKNENGAKDENEDLLNGIQAQLLDIETNKEVATAITDMNGKYEFKDLENGKYIVIFGYNSTTYKLTTYKKEGVEEAKNSDVILTTQNGVNVAKTDIIEVTNNSISNVNIGLVLREIFDLEVTKQIKKVTVKNNAGQTVYEYENTDFTKIEIPSKYFKGTSLVIEYEVEIKNNGQISGYVKTLTDHKPEGLKFASELNLSWYEGTDGNLYCIELGADEILPGETRKIDLILTKEINNTEIQYITNEVELEEVFNEYLVVEKDKADNKAEAVLIVAIKTGAIKNYWSLWLACAIILGTGIYLINKKVVIKK